MNRQQLSRAGLIGGALALTVLLGAAAGGRSQQAPMKLAYINSRAVLAAVPEYQQAESTFARDVD